MTRLQFLLLSGFVGATAIFAQPAGFESPMAGNPKVEIKGRIEKIEITMGEGMPYLRVKTATGTEQVILGSVRYLLEQDFNAKAGDDVVVKGYKVAGTIVAITVTLVSKGKVLKLRDDEGRPVWRRGRNAAAAKGSVREP